MVSCIWIRGLADEDRTNMVLEVCLIHLVDPSFQLVAQKVSSIHGENCIILPPQERTH